MEHKRNSSIELLRIIAIMGVIVLHFNNESIGGGFKYVDEGSINQYYLFFSESLFVVGVNLFVLISGYFLSMTNKRNLSKIVQLFIQVIVFNIIAYVLYLVRGGDFSVKGLILNAVPANYFVVLYSALYIISPYINVIFDRLSEKAQRVFVYVVIAVFSVYSYLIDVAENVMGRSWNGLSSVGINGSQSGYTIVNFIIMYIVGAYIHRVQDKRNSFRCGVVFICSLVCVFGMSVVEKRLGLEHIVAWNYNNPLVIAMAVELFVLAMNIQISSGVINDLAKATFTCFVFHTSLLQFLPIEDVVRGNIVFLIIFQLVVAAGLYLASYIAFKVYDFIIGRSLAKLSQAFISKNDDYINL